MAEIPSTSRSTADPPFPLSILSKLRFPQLFSLFALLFLLDLFIPDLVPFVDEILLGILTMMTGMIRKRSDDPVVAKPPEKNVTPRKDGDGG